MKATFVALLALVVAVGCGKKVQPTDTKQGNNTPKKSAKKKVGKEAQTKTKVTEDNNTKPIKVTDNNATKPIKADDNNATKPVKELTLREKVVGEYERNYPATGAFKLVFLDNGIYEYHYNGKKQRESKWQIVDGKIHVDEDGNMVVYRINTDRSITIIANIDKDGKQIDYEIQLTFKKSNNPTK